MAKYFVQFDYTDEGFKGLLKEGGSPRLDFIDKFIEKLGGKLEALYWVFGEVDGVAILDGMTTETMTAAALALNSSGAIKVRSMPLITAKEVDEATQKIVPYRAPGK